MSCKLPGCQASNGSNGNKVSSPAHANIVEGLWNRYVRIDNIERDHESQDNAGDTVAEADNEQGHYNTERYVALWVLNLLACRANRIEANVGVEALGSSLHDTLEPIGKEASLTTAVACTTRPIDIVVIHPAHVSL